MQKFTITAAGTYQVDVKPGASVVLAASGTYGGTINVKYQTAPGVWADFATPVTLSTPAEKTVINVGAHGEIALVAASTTGTAIVIANVLPA